ncbi:MAG: DUF5665 domain-containing protein [Candidatus Gracilibacteria bacterium]|nr:DUF5665 domain-containing protein [Candidatus Gracilibacteria bacterium]
MEKSVTEKTQIKKMSAKKEKSIEALSPSQIEQVEGLIDAIESAGIQEFIEYIRSPWKMLWPNFIAGVARGFGALVGATIVIALIGWILATIIDLPLIGKQLEPYVEKVQTEFNKYTEANNYRANFERMESTLESIDATLAEQNARELRSNNTK